MLDHEIDGPFARIHVERYYSSRAPQVKYGEGTDLTGEVERRTKMVAEKVFIY